MFIRVKLILFIILFNILVLGSCSKPPMPLIKSDVEFTIITIDSCEYIYYKPYGKNSESRIILHKGDCYYCKKRQEEINKINK